MKQHVSTQGINHRESLKTCLVYPLLSVIIGLLLYSYMPTGKGIGQFNFQQWYTLAFYPSALMSVSLLNVLVKWFLESAVMGIFIIFIMQRKEVFMSKILNVIINCFFIFPYMMICMILSLGTMIVWFGGMK